MEAAPSLTAPPPEPPPPSAEDLVREAQRTRSRGHYAAAIAKAEAALKADPTPAQALQAYEVIGASSCGLRNGNAAREAASHLDDSKREAVRAACEKHGVPIQ